MNLRLLANLTPRRAWLILVLYIAGMVIFAITVPRAVDRAWLDATVSDLGAAGPLAFLAISYFYVVFIPVYNTPIHLAAGFIFGGWFGWLLNFLSATLGLLTIILLVRRFGRPLLEKLVSAPKLAKYDHLASRIGPMTLFLVYVLPVFPDDEVTYVMAASRISLWRYLLPILFGNVTKASMSFIGDKGASGVGLALGSRVVVFAIGALFIFVQERLVLRGSRTSKAEE